MKLSLKGLFRREKKDTVIESFGPMDHAAVARSFGAPTASGKVISEETANSFSAAWACQRIITEAIGSISCAVCVRASNGDVKEDDSHPMSVLLKQSPNADQDPVAFFEAIALGLTQRGNEYSFITRLGGDITSLQPIESRVVPMRKKGNNTKITTVPEGMVFFRVYDGSNPALGTYQDYTRDEVWQVKGFGRGIAGLSPIGVAREAMGVSLAAEEFGARFFSQGGMPSGTMTIPNWLTEEQRMIARENLNQLLGGIGTAHKFALFEGGMKPEPWGGMNLDDMQFILVRKFGIAELARFYRVPLHMLSEGDKAPSSSIETLSQEFLTYTLLPYLRRIESSVNRWLISPSERGKVFLRFNVDDLLRVDSAARSTYFSNALQNGWLNRNEVRVKENHNRVDGLDVYTAQVNLVPVDQLGKVRAPAPTSAGDVPMAPGRPAEPKTMVNVVLPESVRYEVEANTVAAVLSDFGKAVKGLIDKMDDGQRALAHTVASGNDAIVKELADGHAAIRKDFEEGHTQVMTSVVAANETVLEGNTELIKTLRAPRRVKVGDEEFVSESLDG